MNPNLFSQRFYRCIQKALPKGLKTAWWLIKITVPVSFFVLLLDYFGALNIMAGITGPLFKILGLPGVSAIVLITGIFTNVYSVVAVITTLHLPMREGLIIGTMCLVSHNFIIETTVLRKTGSSAIRMVLLRIIGSFVIGWFLNIVIPGHFTNDALPSTPERAAFSPVLWDWVRSISYTTAKILILVVLLLILQQILEEFGIIKWLVQPFSPILKLMGLSSSTTFSWIVANTIGLAYGSAIMIDQVEKGQMNTREADLLNHHVALSHSQLEDPLLFLAIGYIIHWMIWPRVIIAIIAVWLRKFELALIDRRSARRKS
ncbi:MAG: nucleoside recognition domain-containing protein [Bacteroidetes bacterium]|nr:nucleoside recognition domain-containing protein [Bacteroidota bacterium]